MSFPWEFDDAAAPFREEAAYPWEVGDDEHESEFFDVEPDADEEQCDLACVDFLDILSFLYLTSAISAERYSTIC